MTEHIIPIDDYDRLSPRNERAFRLVTFAERKRLLKTTTSHVVQGLLRTGSVAALQGRPGLGKTALAVHLAKCLQDGVAFLDRATKQATVVYVAAEDEDDVARRFEVVGADNVLIAQVSEGLSSQRPEKVVKLITEIAHDARKRFPDRPVVLFIDTLRAALGNESVMEDRVVSPLLNAIRRAAEQNDVCIIILHHTNRENTRASKGETLESVVVCELVLTDGSGDWVNLEIGKNRNGPGRRQIGRVKFGSVTVSQNTVAVIDQLIADETPRGPEDDSEKGLGTNQRRTLTIIESLLCDVTQKIRPFPDGPDVYAVAEKAIIDEYVLATAGDMDNKKREACIRALNGLIGRGLIAKRDLPQGAMVWLVKE